MLKILLFVLLNTTQPIKLPVFVLDSIVVTGKKQNAYSLYSLPDTIKSIKKNSESEEIFNILPSINFEYTGKGYGTLTFRGNDAKNLTVLLDGMPLTIPYSGIFDISQIPSSFFHSLALIPASSPIISGKDAIGGIISITTPPIEKGAQIHFSGGSGNTLKNSVFIGDTAKSFEYLIGYAYERSDGLTISNNNPYGIKGLLPNSYFLRRGVMAKTRLSLKPGTFKLNVLYLNNEKGVPPDLTSERPRYWRFPVWRRTSIFLHYQKNKLHLGIYHDSYFNVLDSYDDSTYSVQSAPYAFHSTYDDYSDGGYIEFTRTTRELSLTGTITTKKDVHREQPDYNEPWKNVDAFFTNLGLHAQNSSNNVKARVTLEGTYYSQGPRKLIAPQFTASIAKVFRNFSALFSVSRRIRFPTLKEMYSTYSGSAYPNPDLKPEVSYNFDIQNFFRINSFKLNFSMYHYRLSNVITKIKVDSLYKTLNVKSARIYGMEASLQGQVKNVSFFTSFSCNSGKDNNDRPLNLSPLKKFSFIFYKPFVAGSIFYIEIVYTGKRHELEKDSIYTHPPYTIVNITLQKHIKNFTLYFKINNLFNTYYEYQRGIPARGLYTETGCKILL